MRFLENLVDDLQPTQPRADREVQHPVLLGEVEELLLQRVVGRGALGLRTVGPPRAARGEPLPWRRTRFGRRLFAGRRGVGRDRRWFGGRRHGRFRRGHDGEECVLHRVLDCGSGSVGDSRVGRRGGFRRWRRGCRGHVDVLGDEVKDQRPDVAAGFDVGTGVAGKRRVTARDVAFRASSPARSVERWRSSSTVSSRNQVGSPDGGRQRL